jgi:hypothetical protein
MTTETLPRTAAPAVVEDSAALVELRAEYELLAAAYRETARRYEVLKAAAQAAIVESRTSRRDPLTRVREVPAELGALPTVGVRLHELPLSSASVWPRGAEVGP